MAPHQTISIFVFAALALLAGRPWAALADPQGPAGPEMHSHSPEPEPYATGDGFLHFPGFPPIPLKPHDRTFDSVGQSPAGTFGQDQGKPRRTDPAPPPKPLTPVEKAESIRKALAPRPPAVAMRKHALDELFGKLAAARDEDEAKGVASLIGGIWMRSDSDTANLLMQRAAASMQSGNYPLALELLNSLTALQPGWPEVWGRRAELRFLTGDFNGSMEDVGQALKLEPRHFGALEVMASVLEHTGFEKRALEVYRRALTIYPHQSAVEKIVEKLKLDVEGQGI